MPLDVDKEVATLQKMPVSQLAERYAELFGEQVCTRHRQHLIRKIIWRMQSLEEGDLSERARKYAMELANDADARVTPPKHISIDTAAPAPRKSGDSGGLSRGTAITKRYKGKTLSVVVLENGFEFEGQRYKSLTAIAKSVTQCQNINGRSFFKVGGAA